MAIKVARGKSRADMNSSIHMTVITIGYSSSPVCAHTDGRASRIAQWCTVSAFLERLHGVGMRADINTCVPNVVLLALALKLLCASALAESAQIEPYRVLVLHSFRNSLPVNTDWYDGLVRGFTSVPDLLIEIDTEAPDLSRLSDTDYVTELLAIYRQKYSDPKPNLIIPTYTPAFRFLLEHGEALFPGVPIVFLGADSRFVAAQELASHITGITTYRDIAGTLELALQVHPDSRRVAVIVGSDDIAKAFERDARQALQSFEGRVEFMWLRGMPLAELTEAVGKLPPQTVILYLVQLQDRNGYRHVPISTLKALSPAAKAPIYGLWDTLLGNGIIGGRLATLEDDGFQAAQMGLRILRGEAPAADPVVYREANSAIFHGPELARWNIDEDRLPAGSRILHRKLSFWEKHQTEIIISGLVISIQALFIASLLLIRTRLQRTQTALQAECTRREQAEAVTMTQRRRLSRFSKERSLGAMATGIAHEINQPLIAIQNYVQAAKRRLQSDARQTAKIIQLLDKIEQQTSRTGDVIQRIRTLVTTNDTALHPVSLYSIFAQAIQVVGVELKTRGCRIDYRPAADLPEVLADELQIELVLVNLLKNAAQSMDSMDDTFEKVVSIELDRINDRDIRVSVADRGPGVAADKVGEIFEPFYSDSSDGMGIGLAVCRDIIEAHGAHIAYTPNPSGGAIFQFALRVAVA